MSKKITILALTALILGLFGSFSPVQAAVSVIPANGGENLPEGSGFVNLTNILISESAPAEIGVGTHTFTLPAGWEFDTSSTINITTTSGIMVINPVSLIPGATSFSFNIEAPAVPGADLAIKSMRVRPTGTSGGYITHSGAAIVGVSGSTNFGTLSVAGGTPPPAPRVIGGGGASGPGAARIAPYNISVSINDGAKTTSNRNISLRLTAEYAGDMIIANDSNNFSFSTLEPYNEFKNWTLSEGNGEKTVYVKFRSPTDFYSDVYSATIELVDQGMTEDEAKEEAEKEEAEKAEEAKYENTDLNRDGKTNYEDLNLLIINWFSSDKKYDINKDGRVDISDFNEIIANWDKYSDATKLTAVSDTYFSVSPSLIQVSEGQVVSVKVRVRPISNTVYTARLALNYPTELLDFESAILGSNWLPLAMGGNTYEDEANGLVVRTAGYPGGTSNEVDFVTVFFTAKKSGSGFISTNSGSVAMDSKGFNKFSGTVSHSSLLVHGGDSASEVIAGAGDSGVVGGDETKDEVVEDQKESRSTLMATVGGFFTSVPGIIILIIILASIAYWLYIRFLSSEEDSEEELLKVIDREREEEE